MADKLVSRGDGAGEVLALDAGTAGFINVGPVAKYEEATADELVKTGPGVFYAITVTAALSAATVVVRDAVAAGAGTVLAVIPASTAAGGMLSFGGVGVRFNTGLYIDFGGTGTVVVAYA
jgi:hypothetical protein